MKFRIYRCDPSSGTKPRYDTYEITPREKMSILDALCMIQAEQDPTLSFRHSCRAGMCGTCAMNVNGIPRWTCRTPLASLKTDTITIEPLRHFPVIKDVTVDMDVLFSKSRQIIPHVVSNQADGKMTIIQPSDKKRVKIADNLECIGCGCCFASCGIPGLDPEYLGPHALNRAFTLVHDVRDDAREERLKIVDNEHGCWRCHTQTACMEVCPKEINTSDAIQDLKREVLSFQRDQAFVPEAYQIPTETDTKVPDEPPVQPERRDFLQMATIGTLGVIALALGIPIGGAALIPAKAKNESGEWMDFGPVTNYPVGKMVEKRYEAKNMRGWDDNPVPQTVFILRKKNGSVQALSPVCTHLGCPVRWVDASRTFQCPCHGGIFDVNGKNTAGPPPKPLDSFDSIIRDGKLYLRGRP